MRGCGVASAPRAAAEASAARLQDPAHSTLPYQCGRHAWQRHGGHLSIWCRLPCWRSFSTIYLTGTSWHMPHRTIV